MRPLTDDDIEQAIGNLLRIGVMVAAVVTAVGGVLYLLQHGWSEVDYRVFHGEPHGLRDLRGVLVGVGQGDSLAIIQLGLLLLIATPIARVALSLLGFVRERDRAYVAITTLVFGILLFSLFGRL